MSESELREAEAKALYEAEASRLQLTFVKYYKYRFYFAGKTERLQIETSFGGNHEDIYREEVTNQPFAAPATFDDLYAAYDYVRIIELGTFRQFEMRSPY